MLLRIFVTIALLAPLVLPVPARAQSVGMSCGQAIATYEHTGRITIRTISGVTLPFYDGVPVSQRNTLRCTQLPMQVRAIDNPRCTIAYKCAPRIHDGGNR